MGDGGFGFLFFIFDVYIEALKQCARCAMGSNALFITGAQWGWDLFKGRGGGVELEDVGGPYLCQKFGPDPVNIRVCHRSADMSHGITGGLGLIRKTRHFFSSFSSIGKVKVVSSNDTLKEFDLLPLDPSPHNNY